MKKQILNIGKALSRAEQKEVFGGTGPTQEGGICQITYPNQPAGCACTAANQCASNSCVDSPGNYFNVCA